MTTASGYQSDADLQDIQFIGDIPVDNTVGGYGLAAGQNDDFELNLDPPLTAYRDGLELQVRFDQSNVGDTRINVNQLGLVPLVKPHNGQLLELNANDLDDTRVYTLIYDGALFQVNIPTINQATTSETGVVRFASEDDLAEDELEDNLAVSSKLLATSFNSSLFKTFEPTSAPLIATTNEVELEETYEMPAETIRLNQGIKIQLIGNFRHSFPPLPNATDKVFRVYVGDDLVFSNQLDPAPIGEFRLEIDLYGIDGDFATQVGWSKFEMHDKPAELRRIFLSNHNWEFDDVVIRSTIQTNTPGQSELVERFIWTVSKIQ
ncbi:MAG: hypothetical protein JXQ90_18375 [Cyclobacteriaceae bacterium]